MTRSPNSEPEQERSHHRFKLLLLRRTSITLGAVLLLGIAGGAWWAWIFVNQRLVPLVERNLRQLIGRPVDIGEVKRFSLNSLRFGSLSIPATPTDPDRLVAEAVEVRFDPWELPEISDEAVYEADKTFNVLGRQVPTVAASPATKRRANAALSKPAPKRFRSGV